MCMYKNSMAVIQDAKQQVLTELKHAVGKGFSPSIGDLAIPPNLDLGDVAFPCFELAKKLGKPPHEIAIELAAKIGPKEYIAEVKAEGPYVNFLFRYDVFGADVLRDIKKEKESYGHSTIGKEKRIMVEYANLNTHKDIHVGHLRNLFVGQMAVDVLRASGYDVVPVSYINDLGAHVAKSVWAIMNLHKDEKIKKEDRISFLRNVYIEANEHIEEDATKKAQVSEIFKNLEEGKGDEVAVWKESRKWSIDYLEKVYDELGLTLETWYFESDLVSKTRKIIDGLIKDEIVVESEGAWIIDLEEHKLGVNLLVKSDSTLLYNAKDIGLAFKKEEDYHPQRSIYVVDARQSHALKQLFKTMELMKFDRDLEHLSYEFVTLKGGAMASRKGNVIRYEDFRDDMVSRAKIETKNRHEDWSEKKLDTVSRAVAFAAMRFGMLKQDTEKKIVFDLDESLSFEGFTGPYLLYTYARIESLRAKAGKLKADYSATKLSERTEHRLLLLLSQYPEIVFQTSSTLHLSQLAQYLFELSRAYAEFYANIHVLTEDEIVSKQRLALSYSVQSVLGNGLKLMGITPVDEM